jgi:hypothetical protein
MTDPTRATLKQLREFFENGGPKVTMTELKQLKSNPTDYDAIANGIGNGTLTY